MGEAPLSEKQRVFAEQLFTENYKPLSRRAHELLKNIDPSAAEDCLSDLFLTLCLCCDRVMEHENPNAWLFLSLKYICLKHIRNTGRKSKQSLPLDESILCISDEGDLEDRIINDILYCQWENQGMRSRLLSGLNKNEREILHLRFEKQLSNKEIGEILGKSEDAIRFTIYYTKKKITEKIYSL